MRRQCVTLGVGRVVGAAADQIQLETMAGVVKAIQHTAAPLTLAQTRSSTCGSDGLALAELPPSRRCSCAAP